VQKIPGFDDKAMGLVNLLIDYGWTGRVTSKGHWLGKAPDGKTTITIPSKMDNASRAERNARATFRKWVREQFPDIAESLDKAYEEENPVTREVLMKRAQKMVTEQNEEVIVNAMQRDIGELLNSIEWPVRSPWMAHKGASKDGGVRYESEAVVQRLWNNGDVDYECAFDGCDYVSKNPRGVAVHYGKTHTAKGQTPPASQDNGLTVDPEYTEPILSRGYKPTDRLVAALAAVLAKLNGHGTDQEKAEAILTWFHERPDIEHTTRPDVPLTDADILFRIRRLVSPGSEETIERLRADAEVLEAERAEAWRERDEAIAQLAKVSRDLNSLKELIEGIGK
jgi:hypothetical protein